MGDLGKLAARSREPFPADEPARPAIATGTCCRCRALLPWPAAKQPKADHRIIGVNAHGDPICNRCHERAPDPSWITETADAFLARHDGDMWGALARAALDMRGKATTAQWGQWFAEVKAQARSRGGLTKDLPYNPQRREPA